MFQIAQPTAWVRRLRLMVSLSLVAGTMGVVACGSDGAVDEDDPDQGTSGEERSGGSGDGTQSGRSGASGKRTTTGASGTTGEGDSGKSGSSGRASSGRASSGRSGATSGGRSGSSGTSGTSSTSGASAVDGGKDDVGADAGSSGARPDARVETGTVDSGTEANPCGVNPVDPKATPETKRLLCYFYSIYGKKVLSGQQVTGWGDAERDVTWYKDKVGKYPAVLGDDFLYNGVTERSMKYWNDGSIVMIRYHMGRPNDEDSYASSQKTTNCKNVITPGTSEHEFYVKNRLGHVADVMLKLQTAKVPVVMALFHEVQRDGWFWWSKCSNDEFNQLWKFSYDYLTNTRGIHNMIRLLPYSGSPGAGGGAPYPGKDQVDIAGGDTYGSDQPFPGLYRAVRNIVGDKMPIPLHETGKVVQPSDMFPTNAPWLMWNIWCGMEWDPKYNNDDGIRRAYASEYTLTRDELPNLK